MRTMLFAALAVGPFGTAAMAQTITGVPGQPGATTAIDGTYLPPPPPPFGGKIGLSAPDSTACWPPIPALLTIDETFDVGVDTRTPVDDGDCQVPFRFTGTVDKVTFKLGPSKLTSLDADTLIRLALAKD
jgi:hypothetical protein